MTRPILPTACLAACLVPAIAGCGYHHIGPVQGTTTIASQAMAPALDAPASLPTMPSAYFPTQTGLMYRYTRTDGTQQNLLGMRTMTFGASTGGGVALVNTVQDTAATTVGASQHDVLSGSVATSGSVLTATVATADTSNTLMSFQLQAPLQPGRTWNARLGMWNWSYVVRNPETVWSPAGNFECLVVQANARPAMLSSLTQIQQTLYFAPGVGLVKVEIQSQSEWGGGNDGRTITEQLASRPSNS